MYNSIHFEQNMEQIREKACLILFFKGLCSKSQNTFISIVLRCFIETKFWQTIDHRKATHSSSAGLRHADKWFYADPCDSSQIMCCWMRKMRVQRASEHGLGSIAQTVPNSIWPSELHRSIRTHEMHEPEGCCIQRLLDTQANHRTLFGAPRCVRIRIGVVA